MHARSRTRRSVPRTPSSGGRRRRRAAATAAGLLLAIVGPGPLVATVAAHGGELPPPPSAATLLLGWSFDPLVWLPAIATLLLWRTAIRRVAAAHPANPVPRHRSVAFAAGIAVILVALDSGIERYDSTLFTVHMVQHLLLTLVAPPLLLAAGPVTLLLRAASPATRRAAILPVLHARPLRVVAHPVVAWLLFAGVMWASHFSPLFDAALEDEWLHRLEHALFLGSGLLFWAPVVGPDPAPWRLRPGARVVHVGLQMPQNTFLAVALLQAPAPLYPHYATLTRPWGPTPLEDQQLAASLMWLAGDAVFVAALVLLVRAWMRDDERRAAAGERGVAAERAAIAQRAARLAAARGGREHGAGDR